MTGPGRNGQCYVDGSRSRSWFACEGRSSFERTNSAEDIERYSQRMAFHHHDKDEPGDTSDKKVEESTTEDEDGPQGMIPARRHRRSWFERMSMRILATGGIIGVDVALGAILTANHVHGWIVGLVVGLVSVVLAAVLWSSRQL